MYLVNYVKSIKMLSENKFNETSLRHVGIVETWEIGSSLTLAGNDSPAISLHLKISRSTWNGKQVFPINSTHQKQKQKCHLWLWLYNPIINFLFLILSCGYAAMQRNNLYISQVYGQKLLEARFWSRLLIHHTTNLL